MAKNDIEYRYFDAEVTETRTILDGEKRFLEGYATRFNTRSKLLFENGRIFNEVIAPNAFDNVIKDERTDVPMNVNHQRGMLLGRTKSKTLNLSIDEKGLKFRCEIPNTTTGNDTYELVKRGDLFENSFAFRISKEGEQWSKSEDGTALRTITNISKLADISVVTDAAYPDTTIAARSYDEFEKPDPKVEEKREDVELLKMRMHTELLKLKMTIK